MGISELFELNPRLEAETLALDFKKSHRLQIANFLTEDTAKTLEKVLKGLEWRLVLNEAGKHFDIHPMQIEALGIEKLSLIVNAAKQRKHTQFQYLYKNYPVADMIDSGRLEESELKQLFALFNSKAVLSFLNKVTDAGVEFCDMQATNFQAGHFLNHHDDAVAGKNRKFAYVYSLSRDWTTDLGGKLEFFDKDGSRIDAFIPQYNTLSIFSVPIMHQVTPVIEKTTRERLSMTGWFRTNS